MNTKVKKGLIIGLSVIGVLFAALLILPYAFKDKIMKLAKEQVNNKLLAKVDFEDFSLSFIRHFPNATVRVENMRIVGVGEFAKDTLISCEKLDLVLNLKSLFSDKGYEIKKLQFSNSHILAHVLPNGKANWSIMKQDTTLQKPDTTKSSFNLKLKDFEIKNADIVYWDEQGKMKAELKNLNHTTSGDLTADSSLLVTKTSVGKINFVMDGVKYLSDADAELNADINANMNQMIFTFSKNSSRINAIPFSLVGWVKMLDTGYDTDLKLNADKVDFKAILSMIPAIYANSFEGVKAGGAVAMTGFMKGKMIGDNYPAFDFKLTAANGWFQYPKLPKSLQNINIAARITNPGKTLDATIIDISKFSFLLGGNPFMAQLRIAYPMSDPELLMKAVGKLNLGNIQEIYPLSNDTKLSGVFDMNLDLGGRMSYYETKQYDKFKFGGNMTITNMIAKMSSMPQDIAITKASMIFNNQYVNLAALQIRIGRNDISATGKLENFVAYALHNKTLKGQLTMQSNYFNVSDFMTPDNAKPEANATKKAPATATTKRTVMVIPKNIDFTLQSDFKQLVYEKMNFTNAKGVLRVLDGDVKFQDMGLQAFGGNITMNGVYSTNDPKKPNVNFDLNFNDVVFNEVFKQVETLQKIVPVFSSASGKFSTKFSFNSLLQNDMMPDLASLVGNGSFSTKSVGLSNVQVLTSLASTLKRPELANTTIKDLGLNFEIKDGKLNTKPFNVTLGNIKMNLGGSTGLDKSIAYTGKVQLPDKFKLGQFSTVNMKIGGTFSKPKISLDLTGTLNSMVGDAKAKAVTEVNKQVDVAKAKAMEEARKQKEAALKTAQDQADRIRNEAQKLSDKLIADAKAQGDQLVAKASNPFTKRIAEAGAQKLVDEATKKAADINAKADVEAKKIIQKAAETSK
ncbi:MAG: AsmA-like C-terminal region-containing protein [Paludibacter sp.]|nr:AsmA-like C-terminal region-containing protein [Paludibacter sp.]